MADSQKKSESWLKMLIAALVGAILTGSTQYILNERQFAQRTESEHNDIIRKYLESELLLRREKYIEIREKVYIALLTREPQAVESAKQALESGLPFFEARYETQLSIGGTAKELLTYFFESSQAISKSKPISLDDHDTAVIRNQLERDFQNDLNRIEGMLFSVSNAKSEHQPSVGSSPQ